MRAQHRGGRRTAQPCGQEPRLRDCARRGTQRPGSTAAPAVDRSEGAKPLRQLSSRLLARVTYCTPSNQSHLTAAAYPVGDLEVRRVTRFDSPHVTFRQGRRRTRNRSEPAAPETDSDSDKGCAVAVDRQRYLELPGAPVRTFTAARAKRGRSEPQPTLQATSTSLLRLRCGPLRGANSRQRVSSRRGSRRKLTTTDRDGLLR